MNPPYDAFLSYSSEDRPAVRELAGRLVERGINVWFDKDRIRPGDDWMEKLEEGLEQSDCCVVFFGSGGFSRWQKEEMNTAIARRVSQDKAEANRVFLVFLPGTERSDGSQIPPFMRRYSWVEFSKTTRDEEAFDELVWGIKEKERKPTGDDAKSDGRCPYMGLAYFEVDDSKFFHGREELTEKLLGKLRSKTQDQPPTRFLAITGNSGSGKSSLVRAGLVAKLRAGAIEGSEKWPILILRPGSDPLESLATKICNQLQQPPGDVKVVNSLMGSLRTIPEWLHRETKLFLERNQSHESDRVIIVVDQFEEVFTLCTGEDRKAFIANLLHAAQVPEGQTWIVLAMRADFYGKCADDPELAKAVSEHNFLVGPMSEEELGQAVRRPAELVSCEVEPDLVERLVQQVKDAPGSLPLLQYTLQVLWEKRDGRVLTLKKYEDIGQLAGALKGRADEIYNALSDSERELCRKVFLRLVQPGEGTEDTKRRVPMVELIKLPGDVQTLLRKLASKDFRLLVIGRSGMPQQEFVELAHEVLIRAWPQLVSWIDADRQGQRVLRRINRSAREWADSHKEASYLYRGAALAVAREWADSHSGDLNEEESEFLKASKEAEALEKDKELQAARKSKEDAEKQRKMFLIAAIVMLVLASIAWFAFMSEKRQRQIARARQLASQAALERTTGNVDLQLLCLLDIESLQRLPSVEADQVFEEALNLLPRPLTLLTNAGSVSAITYNSNGVYLVSTNSQGAQAWRADTANPVGELATNLANVTALAFTPDGRLFATGCEDGIARLWETASGHPVGQPMTNEAGINLLVFSPNGGYLATASGSKARIWSTHSYQPLGTNATHGRLITSIAFMPTDEKSYATGSEDSTVMLWNTTTGNTMAGPIQHSKPVNAVAFSLDGRYFATACDDGSVRLLEMNNLTNYHDLECGSGVQKVAFSHNSKHLAAVGVNGDVQLWNVADRKRVFRVSHNGKVGEVIFSPNDQYLATASYDHSARVWETSSGREISRMCHANWVQSIAFSPDGSRLATTSLDGSTRTWEIGGYSAITTNTNGIVFASQTNPTTRDGKLAARISENTVVLYLPASERKTLILTNESFVNAVAFSSDGRNLAVANGEPEVCVYKTSSVSKIVRLSNEKLPEAVAFNPSDGNYLAVAYSDSTLGVWDLKSAQQIVGVTNLWLAENVAFTQDGRYLAGLGEKGVVRLWLWQVPDLTNVASLRLTRNLTTNEWARYFYTEPYHKTIPGLK